MNSNPNEPWLVRGLRVVWVSCWFTLSVTGQMSQGNTALAQDLMSMSLEELMDIQVEIATRTPRKVSEVPAAVTVLTGDDVRRSGATSLAEALRMSPGVDAQQINNNSWAVGIRGFNSYLNNKLLVLVDGRSTYAPLFAGTYWDAVDTVLDDIDRIEIIRGPGASVWGANSMNGVVNIITKSAKETQGTLAKVGYGSELQGLIAGRHGMKLGENVFLRAFGKYSNTGDSELRGGGEAFDKFSYGRGGFRLDWEPQETTQVTFQSDIYSIQEHNVFAVKPVGGFSIMPLRDNSHNKGGNVLGRLTKEMENGNTLTFQGYYDRSDRKSIVVNDIQNIGDLELTLEGPQGEKHEWSGGVGYRVTHDHVSANQNETVSFTTDSRKLHLFNAFVQDTIALSPESWFLTLGSKFEHNDYTCFEVQPGLRLQYSVNPKHTLWSSVTRAIRTPSRLESDVRFVAGTPVFPVTLQGSTKLRAENMMAYEMGYKGLMTDWWTMEAALFFNDYDDLVTNELLSMGNGMVTGFANDMSGESYGIEWSSRFQVNEWWNLVSAYTLQYNEF